MELVRFLKKNPKNIPLFGPESNFKELKLFEIQEKVQNQSNSLTNGYTTRTSVILTRTSVVFTRCVLNNFLTI
jgi:hypothetical protein